MRWRGAVCKHVCEQETRRWVQLRCNLVLEFDKGLEFFNASIQQLSGTYGPNMASGWIHALRDHIPDLSSGIHTESRTAEMVRKDGVEAGMCPSNRPRAG